MRRWLTAILVRGRHAPFIRDDLEHLYARDRAQGASVWRAHWRYAHLLAASALSIWRDALRRSSHLDGPGGMAQVIDAVLQDVRYGARLLWRSPGFTACVVLSLALGIGAAAAVFSVADAVLLRPLAANDPGQLFEFRATAGLGGALKQLNRISLDGLRALGRTREAGEFIGFRTADDRLLKRSGSGALSVRVEMVSENYFDVLGVTPLMGRLPGGSESYSGSIPMVLTEHFWRGQIGADPDVIGQAVTIGGAAGVIAGVTREFTGMLAERPADVIVPAAVASLVDPATASTGFRVVMRLRDGLTVDVAEQRLAAVYRAVLPDPRLQRADIRVTLADASRGVSDARESMERPLVLGLALVAVLLLVASANAGGLLLARFTSRSSEFAIRHAIGAGRRRLLRQVLVESVLIAGLAASAGFLIARAVSPLLLGLAPYGPTPVEFELRFDWRLLSFTLAIAAAAGLVAGGAPLFRLLSADPSLRPVHETRSVIRGRRRVTETLIAVQVACALLLVVAAGAMARTLVNLGRVDPGFDADGVLAIAVDAAGRTRDDASLAAYYLRLHEQLESLPQIERVTSVQFGIMTGAETTGTVEIAGWSPVSDDDRWARLFWVGPDFFDVLRMPLLAGSGLGREQWANSEHIAVVSRAFAEFYFGSISGAVGRTINGNVRIVGVAGDASYGTLRDQPIRAMFVPYTHAPSRTVRTFLARTSGDTRAAIRPALAAMREHDPSLSVQVTTLKDQIATTVARERFVAIVAVILSMLSLALACTAIYAAVAYAVAERRRELAVRVALGATRRDIVGLVLKDPFRVTIIGLTLGVPAAYALMHSLAALLFGVTPLDAAVIPLSAVGLLAISAAAALLPAHRAATVDPQECFKCS